MSIKKANLSGIVSRAEQEAWLAEPHPKLTSTRRHYERGDRHRYRRAFEAFRDNAHWPALRRILRLYVSNAIIEPFATEAEYWSVIVKPTYLRFNLFGQETFSLARTENASLSCWIHAKSSLLAPLKHKNLELFRSISLIFDSVGADTQYEPGGVDQICLHGMDLSDDEAFELLESADLLAAVKAFNLELMRKGRDHLKSFHCFDIIDDVMEGLYGSELEQAAPRRLNVEELHRRGNLEFAERILKLPSRTRIRRETIERIGQEIFREQQFRYWSGKCPVTGIDEPKLLRASHIKSWASCESSAERIYVYNGLLLAAHLDAAFDAGLISFSDDGRILRGRALSDANFAALGVPPQARLDLAPDHRGFLAWHRRRHGFAE